MDQDRDQGKKPRHRLSRMDHTSTLAMHKDVMALTRDPETPGGFSDSMPWSEFSNSATVVVDVIVVMMASEEALGPPRECDTKASYVLSLYAALMDSPEFLSFSPRFSLHLAGLARGTRNSPLLEKSSARSSVYGGGQIKRRDLGVCQASGRA